MTKSKFFDPLKVFIPNADELGHKLGESLPKVGSAILDTLKRFKLLPEDMGSLPAPVAKLLPELLKMAGGGIEIPRDRLPEGQMYDVLHDYLNEIIDALGRGAADKLRANGNAPDDKSGAAKKEGGNADPKARLGYVVNGRWYPANCTHVARPFAGRGQKAPDDITLEEALLRKHSACGDCVRDLDPVAAKPVQQSEAKGEEPKPAPKEHPLPSAGHTLFDLFERLREEDGFQYEGNWDEFVRLTDKDHELKGKFILAFNKRGSYEQFKKLVLLTRSVHWHHQLDLLLGESKPSTSYLKQKAEEEREQWARAVKGITSWLKKRNVEAVAELKKADDEIEALKLRYHGKSKDGGSSRSLIITLGALAILLVSVYVILNV